MLRANYHRLKALEAEAAAPLPTRADEYLRTCAADYLYRHKNPRVAWDCIAAKTWSDICLRLADEVAGMPMERAVGYLKAMQQRAIKGTEENWPNKGPSPVASFLSHLDASREFDRILDPIAHDRVGYIQVQALGNYADFTTSDGVTYKESPSRPYYRRMLGINNQVGGISRQDDESDELWLARRRRWLSQYHPGIMVVAEGGWFHRTDVFDQTDIREPTGWQYTPFYGRVGEFIEERHLVAMGTWGYLHMIADWQPAHFRKAAEIKEEADRKARAHQDAIDAGISDGSVAVLRRP